ncbi:hypothetical protein DID88_006051 [Monilinia fructigena]|uniref:Uncharacterized protein n=1 Tax=Monilinia fructigena TaxID=38457 RepID=A0A395IDX8_9HELO|nr:hypothetical protein DID88_006051 [Monilinia fructigena]
MSPPTTTAPTTTKLELRTAYGPVYRDVLNAPPRPCTDTEIPIIDLSNINSPNLSDRQVLAAELWHSSISPTPKKTKIDKSHSRYFNGYMGLKSSNISPGESVDVKKSIAWRYEPEYDPDHPQPLTSVPTEVVPFIRGESFVWEGTSHLPNFKHDTLAYWKSCLVLARKLVRVFALSLSLPEDYFDSRVTYPGADGLYNYYPPSTEAEKADNSVGLGLNFNCVEGVIPTCTDENNPPKYEPISCGDWCQLRFKLENEEYKKKTAQAQAPSAIIIEV